MIRVYSLCSAALFVSAATLFAGSLPLDDTRHNDGRDTPKLVLPAPTGLAHASPRDAAEAFIKAHSGDFQIASDLSTLKLTRVADSLAGTHFHYQQMIGDVPVENAEIVVSISRQSGEVYQAYNNSWPVKVAPKTGPTPIGVEAALDAAWQHLRVHGKLRIQPRCELMYMPEGGGFRLIYRTLVNVDAPNGEWEHKVDAQTGLVIAVRDTTIDEKTVRVLPDFAAYSGPVVSRQDATLAFTQAAEAKAAIRTAESKTTVDGTALVFDPDPRTTLQNGALLDTSPASAFTNAYMLRTLRDISLNAGVYTLDGPWVTIVEISGELPLNAPSTTTTGQWLFQRGTNAFNDAMTYYHIDTNQRYLRSLGYTNIQAAPIQVDTDGVSGDDNSHYMGGANYLAFGHGGVDDNEDIDVILHEYGHAITHSIVPSWGGGDTGAIGEGFGDYWGGSYSYSTSNGPVYHPEWAFSWDGHGADTWSGRMMNKTNLTYDPAITYVAHQTLSGTANYSDQLWSAPLYTSFIILTQMGYARTNLDKIVIESFYGISGNPTMRDMATATINAARTLYPADPYARIFFENFVRQRILPVSAPKLLSPVGGEIYTTGAVVRVSWDKLIDSVNTNVSTKASMQMEYYIGGSSTIVFQDSMESGVNGWTVGHSTGSVDWAQVTTTNHSASHSWFASDPATTTAQFLVSPAVLLGSGYTLSFWHRYSLESTYDGGVVELSTNGVTWFDIGTNSTQNGYNATISAGDGSLIAGRRAFSGTSSGFVETLIPLTAFAGKTVNIRFRAVSDSMVSGSGWWVDDVTIGYMPSWQALGTAASNSVYALWTLPLTPSTNYQVHIRHTGTNWESSAWQQSQRFTISVDSDLDGIPDEWETRCFTNLTAATAVSDRDGDGSSDYSEYLAGTDPANSNSVFAVATVQNPATNAFVVSWASISNKLYDISRATNGLIAGFTPVITNIPATPPVNTYTDRVDGIGNAFYRLNVSP